jgi:hypothetical protein
MASITSPLQLTVFASLAQNQGLEPFPPALAAALAAFNSTTVMQNFFAAVSSYKAQSFATQSTLTTLLTIGATVCPALGNSIPESPVGSYPYLDSEYLINYFNTADGSTIDPSGFSMLIEQTCAAYLGNGDASKFAQGFMAVQGYIASTNKYINSSVNANQYLGPFFTNMDNLTTANISSMTTDLTSYGVDLANQGNLWSFKKLDLYGTPAGLLQQISSLAGIKARTVPDLQNALLAAGLTTANIADLVNDNRVGLNKPNGLTPNDFDKLQVSIYAAMTTITGDALTQILDILGVTTPNINTLADLLNPVVMFPLSYASLQTPSPDGAIPIFDSTGAVNSNIAPVVNSYLPTATGCDELGKIIPPAQATANKAIQVAFQQINNIPNSTLPKLANAVLGTVNNTWNVATQYLANTVVSYGSPVPSFYRAIVDVPVGIDINNTGYWTPTTLGGLSTMADLPLIQAQTTPVDSSVTNYISTTMATGTGPNGTITTYDVLGLALDADNFAAQLNTATAAINTMQGAGSLASLNTAYNGIASAANEGQAISYIADANTAIAALSANANVPTLNAAWVYMANFMNLSAKYTSQAGIDYFNLQSSDKNSIYSFCQNLPYYGLLTANGDAAEFLENIANTTTLGGQSIVGAMREGRNNARLSAASLYNTNQIPSNPEVAPIPVINPVT